MLRSGKCLLIVSVHWIQLFELVDEALINQERRDRKKKKTPLSCHSLSEEVDKGRHSQANLLPFLKGPLESARTCNFRNLKSRDNQTTIQTS